RVQRDEVRADPARRVRAHDRHLVPGRAAVPGRLAGAGSGVAGTGVVPAQGDGGVPGRDLGALVVRADPGGPDPGDLLEAAPAVHGPPADGHRAVGRPARSAWRLTARSGPR